jgi:hypothetical protein
VRPDVDYYVLLPVFVIFLDFTVGAAAAELSGEADLCGSSRPSLLPATGLHVVEGIWRLLSCKVRLGVLNFNGENFPAIAVGIRDPYFILPREAAVHIYFIDSHKSRVSESFFRRQYLGGVVDFDAKVIECAPTDDFALVQRQIEGRLRDIELGVARLPFHGSHSKHRAIELYRFFKPADVECQVDFHLLSQGFLSPFSFRCPRFLAPVW